MNRFKQTLYNKINAKKSQIQNTEEKLTYSEILRIEKLDDIRKELDETSFLDNEEEIERFEARIEEA